MSTGYNRFLKLLEKWPVDKTKSGRDLGEFLREQFKNIVTPEAIVTDISPAIVKQVESLERIASNAYGNKYQRNLTSTATGLNAEQCKQVLSSEFLEYLNEDKSIFKRK